MPVIAHDFQGPFTVDFLLQSPQGLFYRLAFFELNLGQNTFTSSPSTSDREAKSPPVLFSQAKQSIFPRRFVNLHLLKTNSQRVRM